MRHTVKWQSSLLNLSLARKGRRSTVSTGLKPFSNRRLPNNFNAHANRPYLRWDIACRVFIF